MNMQLLAMLSILAFVILIVSLVGMWRPFLKDLITLKVLKRAVPVEYVGLPVSEYVSSTLEEEVLPKGYQPFVKARTHLARETVEVHNTGALTLEEVEAMPVYKPCVYGHVKRWQTAAVIDVESIEDILAGMTEEEIASYTEPTKDEIIAILEYYFGPTVAFIVDECYDDPREEQFVLIKKKPVEQDIVWDHEKAIASATTEAYLAGMKRRKERYKKKEPAVEE